MDGTPIGPIDTASGSSLTTEVDWLRLPCTHARGLIPLSAEKTVQLRLAMQNTALLDIYPVAFLGAIWVADLSGHLYFMLALIGIAALFSGYLSLLAMVLVQQASKNGNPTFRPKTHLPSQPPSTANV